MSIQEKAFPNPHLTHETGMTVRDYFAGQALASINLGIGVTDEYYARTAMHCYALADAMMEARNGKQ